MQAGVCLYVRGGGERGLSTQAGGGGCRRAGPGARRQGALSLSLQCGVVADVQEAVRALCEQAAAGVLELQVPPESPAGSIRAPLHADAPC